MSANVSVAKISRSSCGLLFFFFFGFRVNLSDISSRNVSYNSRSYVMFTLLFLDFKVQY